MRSFRLRFFYNYKAIGVNMKHIKKIIILIFFSSLTVVGSFHEETSCLFTVLFSISLTFYCVKEKRILLKINLFAVSIFAIVFGYLITAFWAIDSGTAILGFFKYLPILIFSVVIMQDNDLKEKIFTLLPYFSATITVITAIFALISPIAKYFTVAGRFAGCFEYPNTFALLLLISELLIISKKQIKKYDIAVLAILVFGILFTGSRTVFVITVVSNSAMIIRVKNKIIKLCFAGLFGLSIIGIIIYTFAFGNNVFGRFLTIGIKESTFIGRFLYFRDALPVIIKHPFGLGYGGYYYIQQTIQTGVYSVKNIHNDFLQILLDIGWAPGALFISAIIKALLNRNSSFENKIIISTFVLHSCFDFNLQFVSMFFVLILLMGVENGKEITVKPIAFFVVILTILNVLSIYFGMALLFFRKGKYNFSKKLYPYYTENNIELLKKAETADEMNEISDEILKQNKYVSICYSAKARAAYSNGDFKSTMEYKHKLFEYAPFAFEDYKEYCYMLVNAISIYSRSGDLQSADYCKRELIETYNKLSSSAGRLSKLGRLIKDQPQTELPDDLTEYILILKGNAK